MFEKIKAKLKEIANKNLVSISDLRYAFNTSIECVDCNKDGLLNVKEVIHLMLKIVHNIRK